MIVQHNLSAMNASRMLGITKSNLAKNSEKISSGYKINRAADDAAGLSMSEKMRRQIRGLAQASANAEDGISAVQTAEGALTEVHDMLQRMNELAIKAANGTMSEGDRENVQEEMDSLVTEIDRVSAAAKFNETYLLKGDGVGDYKSLSAEYYGTGVNGDVNSDANGLMNIQVTDKAVYGDDATAVITVANVEYSLKDYANASELVSDINTNPQIATLNAKYTYKGYTVGEGKSSATGHTLTATKTIADTTNAQSLQTVGFRLQVDAATGITKGGSIRIKIGNVETNITANSDDTQSSLNIKASNALKEKYGEKNVSLNSSTNVFTVTVPPQATAITAQAIQETKDLEFNLQVGADTTEDNKIKVAISSIDSLSLGVASLDVTTEKGATRAVDNVSEAIKKVSSLRSAMGAVQNRLEHTISSLDNVIENTTAAESRIRDLDMAEAMVEYSKNNVLQEAGISILAQANQSTQGVLALLQ